MSKVAIKYTFIFDPAETWSAQSSFEGDLATLLSAKGLEAELIEMQGNENEKYLYIRKAPMPMPDKPKPSVQQNINKLEQKRDEGGRYLNVK